jgi:L-ascorbate metabolism protein UlaG (beta-lactamase superfamily)
MSGGASLQYLGWSAILVTSKSGVRVVVDPLLAGDGTIPPSSHSPQDLSDADLVLVSHAAKDHVGNAFEIVHAGNATLGASIDVRLLAREAGIDDARMVSMVPNSPFVVDDVTVIPTEAKHLSTAKHANGQWLIGQALSFFIRLASGACIFHPGDTAITTDLELYGRLYQPTIGLLGVGGVPQPGRQSVVEMSPWEAGIAAGMLGLEIAIPCHYLPNLQIESAFIESVRQNAPTANPKVLAAGDLVTLREGAVTAEVLDAT